MRQTHLTIINRLGMHARASARFVKLASEFKSEITLIRNGQQANGKSIMGIMLLAAAKGAQIELHVQGQDEEAAFTALSGLVTNRFGEPD